MSSLPRHPDPVLEGLVNLLAPELRAHMWATPGEMAQALDPSTVQTPALDLIDGRLAAVAGGDVARQVFNMPPQEGKSQRITRWFVLWALHRNPNLRVAIISANFALAAGFSAWIRDMIATHPDLGLVLSKSTAAKHEFKISGYAGGVYAVGIGGNLVGRPVDLMVIDDPYASAQDADSKAWQTTVRQFWTDVARPRLAPKAPVVLVQTRWREDDLAGWLIEQATGWEVLNIPAQADHDPSKGEVDVLGRAPGEYMVSARGNDVADWELKRLEVGSRTWNAQYQGRPSPVEGEFFKRIWWSQYDRPLWIDHADGYRVLPPDFDELMTSWDMTFKGSEGTDFVVGQVWMRRGGRIFLLDQVRGRMNFPQTQAAVKALAARWPQCGYHLVEDKANGSAIIASLSNALGVPVIPEEPHGGKEARASAVSPWVEAGNVCLPDPMLCADMDTGARPFAWVSDFIEEAAGFPTATHDDQVDAMTQALNRLGVQPYADGRVVSMADFDDEFADHASFMPRI